MPQQYYNPVQRLSPFKPYFLSQSEAFGQYTAKNNTVSTPKSDIFQHCQHAYLTTIKILTCRDFHHLIVLLLDQTFNNQRQTPVPYIIKIAPTNQAIYLISWML